MDIVFFQFGGPVHLFSATPGECVTYLVLLVLIVQVNLFATFFQCIAFPLSIALSC